MSTTSQTNLSTAFATDGTTYSFPFTFPITAASELRGALVNDATGVETPLSLATHFSAVLSTPPTEGGTITCRQSLPSGDPWPSGSTLRFWREVPLTQELSLPGVGTKMSTTAIAATLDKLTRAVQQIASQAARALRVHNVQDPVDPLITEGQDDKVLVVESGAVALAPRSEFKGDKGDQGDQGATGDPGPQAWSSGEGAPTDPPEDGVLFYQDLTSGILYRYEGLIGWVEYTDLTGPPGVGWSTSQVDPSSPPNPDLRLYKWLNTATGCVWSWNGSTWVQSASLKGPAGEDGAPGGPWLKGSGAPDNGDGADGDWYLDTASEKVYEKQSGAWSEIADFSGGGGGSLTSPLVLPGADTESGITFPFNTGAVSDYRLLISSGGSFRFDSQSQGADWSSPCNIVSYTGGEDLVLTGGSDKFVNASGQQLVIANGKCDTASAFQVAGTQVVAARVTGWGAPTGTATRTTFATTTVTLEELAQRVKALIDDLTTHGLIGPTP
jgi:hypothetical protein